MPSDGPQFENSEEVTWECPHDAMENRNVCPFHFSSARFVSDIDLSEEFYRTIQKGNTEFVGCSFGNLRLDDDLLDNSKLLFYQCKFYGDFTTRCEVQPSISFIDLDIYAEIKMHDSNIHGELRMHGCEVSGGFELSESNISGPVVFTENAFYQRFRIVNSEFKDVVNLSKNKYRQFDFSLSELGKRLFIRHCRFFDYAGFHDLESENYLTLIGSEFHCHAVFSNCRISDGVSLSSSDESTEFHANTYFHNMHIPDSNLDGLDLSDTDFKGSDISNSDLSESVLFSCNFSDVNFDGAKLIGADLRESNFRAAQLDRARISEGTRFLGQKNSEHSILPRLKKDREIHDPNFPRERATSDIPSSFDICKSVYRSLEDLGRANARPSLERKAFVLRQDAQRCHYQSEIKNGKIPRRVYRLITWTKAECSRWLFLYGESPWRIIFWSAFSIISFAILYSLGGWVRSVGPSGLGQATTWSDIAANPAVARELIYYSTLTFTTLGFGDFRPVGFGQVLSTVEAALGTVFVALLVFVLGRRASR